MVLRVLGWGHTGTTGASRLGDLWQEPVAGPEGPVPMLPTPWTPDGPSTGSHSKPSARRWPIDRTTPRGPQVHPPVRDDR